MLPSYQIGNRQLNRQLDLKTQGVGVMCWDGWVGILVRLLGRDGVDKVRLGYVSLGYVSLRQGRAGQARSSRIVLYVRIF